MFRNVRPLESMCLFNCVAVSYLASPTKYL